MDETDESRNIAGSIATEDAPRHDPASLEGKTVAVTCQFPWYITRDLRPFDRSSGDGLRVTRSDHAIADPALVADSGRVGPVVGQLAAETPDEGAHPVRIRVVVPGPGPALQLSVGHGTSRVEREHAQELVLGGGETEVGE